MENKQKNNQDNDSINLVHLAKSLWRRAWAILLITLLMGGAAFGFTKLFIKPKYSSYVEFYVNSGMSFSGINISQINAGRTLVDTYLVILNTRTTMLEVKEKADVNESWSQISGMVSAGSRNGTEVFRVTVTSNSPEKSQKIAQAIGEVLPVRVGSIMDGHSMKLVEKAVVNSNKVAPNTTKNILLGMVVGFVASCILFAVLALLDDTIHSEDYITENYDLPILAKIPNLAFDSKDDYYYKKSYTPSATEYAESTDDLNKTGSEESAE